MIFDLSKRYCYYFNEICKIPHGSYNEKALSDYVVQFAKDHRLEYIQDDMHNVIVRKPCTKGYEEYDPVMLQAHMDMVCEATQGTEFDFTAQPISTYVDEEGNLRARSTTLGADDGMGVAEMLAILEDSTLQHPELECVFTVQEEVGLFGALGLDKSLLKSHRMISLDGAGETQTSVSSAGGINAIATIPVQWCAASDACYALMVTGFSGGHSGSDIHKEKGNASKVTARILRGLQRKGIAFHLVSINGGQKINAICRQCTAVICTAVKKAVLEETVQALYEDIYKEFAVADPGFKVVLNDEKTWDKCMDTASTDKVIQYLYIIPDGFQHRSMEIEGLTLTSLNLGIVQTRENAVSATSSIRSALSEAIEELVCRLDTVAGLTGGKVLTSAGYPAWAYAENSSMRQTFNEVVQDLYDGQQLQCRAAHGGLECAVFTQVEGGMDIITCGPVAGNFHTPQEYLNLESWDRTYRLLVTILSKVSKKA